MALPVGITTATVTVGVPVTHAGAPVKTFVSIEPSVFLVHAATGTPLVDFMEELDIAEGVAGQFTLPHTDQGGFTDENGNAYTNWYYTARVTYTSPSKAKVKAPKIKVFQLTTGQTEVDLDKLPGGAPALPYTAPTAKVDAFNGRTGAVTLLEADLPDRLSEGELSATYARPERDQSLILAGAKNLENYGLILGVGGAAAFDEGKVESPDVFFDKASSRLAMLYTGYTNTGPTGVASHGIAYSDDGITWTKAGQFLTGSGVPGSPDEHGVTGPVLYEESGTYHLFYIGLTAVGYEGGTPSICHASATSLAGPWTRNGRIIPFSGADTGITAWRKQYTWRPNIVKSRSKYYLFFNATGQDGLERAGYATATTLSGPWTIDDANAPILPAAGHTTDAIWGGDPFVYREDDHWRMEFGNADPSWGPVGDWWATTTDDLFPLGWTIGGQSTSSSVGGMKPWITRWNGLYLHYASTAAGITVSVAKVPRRFAHKSVDNFDSSVIVGDNINAATGAGRAKVSVGSTTGISEVIVGQDSTHCVLFSWAYNATVNNATALLETYAGSNQLNIQNNTGTVVLGGAGGKVALFGGAGSTKPVLTYSRAIENAAQTQIRTALVALNAVTDSTVA